MDDAGEIVLQRATANDLELPPERGRLFLGPPNLDASGDQDTVKLRSENRLTRYIATQSTFTLVHFDHDSVTKSNQISVLPLLRPVAKLSFAYEKFDLPINDCAAAQVTGLHFTHHVIPVTKWHYAEIMK